MKIANSVVIGAAILFSAIAAPAADTGTKSAGSTPKEVTIPKDAVANPDGNSFSYTDKNGKKWIYAKTPFGVIKRAAGDETAAAKGNQGSAASVPTKANFTRAIDKGDTVRFERQSPFGVIAWEKKKLELNDNERHILESQNAKTEQK